MAADHIFLGTVQAIHLIDSSGMVVDNPPSLLPRGMRIVLTIRTDPQWIVTPLKKLPSMVEVTYDYGKMILSYDTEKERYLNKRWVFLLSGNDFHPVYFLAFAEPETKLNEITEIISRGKKPVE